MSLDRGLAVLLSEFFESEGSLAYASLGGLVVYLVDVGENCANLGLDFSNKFFHNCSLLSY